MSDIDRAFADRINASRRTFSDGELLRLAKPYGKALDNCERKWQNDEHDEASGAGDGLDGGAGI